MRDQLLDLVRPLAEELAEELADLLAERVGAMLVEVGHAMDIALSAATSALGDAESSAPAPMPTPDPASAPAPVARRARRDRPRKVPPEPQPDGQSTDKRAKNGKAWPSCRLCGKRGVTARTHPAHCDAPEADAPEDRDIKPANPPKSAPADRLSAIRAAAAKRRVATPLEDRVEDRDEHDAAPPRVDDDEVRELDFGGDAA